MAAYDGLIALPKKHETYKNKLKLDGIKVLSPQGGEKSLHGKLKEAFGIEQFVDANGNVTKEAIDVKNAFSAEYEAKEAERAKLNKQLKKTKIQLKELP